jgi:hypothetical protein
MKKKFNITGLCFPDQHYMADVSKKLAQSLKMIDEGEYFVINRPRQYGKTTTLYSLADRLMKTGEYIVFNMSFEGVGDLMFDDEKTFSKGFVELLANHSQVYAPELATWLLETAPNIDSLKLLSSMITTLVNKTAKKMVVMIDEVDKSSNNQLFISFLAMLRNKYLQRGQFKTFHSVVLAGVHDVKSLKLKLRPDDEQKYNSPWNIAAEFKVDMNLQPSEIKPMLDEYSVDKGVAMNTQEIADCLFYFTSGYPFLVSKLCKMLDEEFMPEKEVKEWTVEDIDIAAQRLIREQNTNFDSVIKNLENYPNLYELVYNILVIGDQTDYNIYDPVVSLGMLHGIFKNGQGIRIHNRIYQELIYHYMTSKTKSRLIMGDYTFSPNFRLADNRLDMEMVLTKFQAFMKEQYSKHDRDFVERNGRLVFLAFIKPIINGSGFDFKEPQISEERRLDVIITYFEHRYLAELKIWRGPAAHKTGLAQLADYLNRQAIEEGYLIIFDQRKKKSWKKEWVKTGGKKVFVIWV